MFPARMIASGLYSFTSLKYFAFQKPRPFCVRAAPLQQGSAILRLQAIFMAKTACAPRGAVQIYDALSARMP